MKKLRFAIAALSALAVSAPAMALTISTPTIQPAQQSFAYNGTISGTVNGTTPFTTTLNLAGGATSDSNNNPLLVDATATTPLTGLLNLGTLNVSVTQNSSNFFFDTLTFSNGNGSLEFGNFSTPSGINLDSFGMNGSILGGSFSFGGKQIAITGGSGILSFSAAVPEPATWAMMLVGFGAIGFTMRRKRNASLAIA